MLPKISYIILFGVISIATGKPARNEGDTHYVQNELDLQKLLQTLSSQGNNNHNDRASSSPYHKKPGQKYGQTNHYNKAGSRPHNELHDNALEDSSSINNLHLINQLLQKSDYKQESNSKSNLIEDILSNGYNSHGYNSYTKVKPNPERTEFLDQLKALLDKLDANGNYASGKNIKYNLINDKTGASNSGLPRFISDPNSPLSYKLAERADQSLLDHIKFLLVQAKAGLLELFRKLVGNIVRNSNGNNRLSNIGDLTYESKLRANKIKVNDELDAVIFELSDVEQLLRNLDSLKQQNTNKFTNVKLIEKADLKSLLSNNNGVDKKSNVEAVVFDLTHLENGDAVAKQIKRLLTQNNKGSVAEYDDYANLGLDSNNQELLELEQLADSKKRLSQKGDSNANPPQWLLDELRSRIQPKRMPLKKLLIKQRQQRVKGVNKNRVNQNRISPRIFRRSLMQDVGVPFSLEVQGLGQVNP